MRSPEFKRSPTPPPIYRLFRACIRALHATTEYKRHGTLSLLAGIDLRTGHVHACVEDRHRSREFVAFLRKVASAYPTDTAIKIILDNHSAHRSKETRKWVDAQPDGRLTFVFIPKHGSWLNVIEGFFSKMGVRCFAVFG